MKYTPNHKIVHIIDLNIAGFNIHINFYETDRVYMRNKLIKEILSCYIDFKTKNSLKKWEYTINFIVNERADIIFNDKTNRNHINFYEHETESELTTYYQISIFQFQIILINILHKLLAKSQGFLLHASANTVNNQAVLFLGDHGSGKSTIMKFLNYRYQALADDSAIVKKRSKYYYFYQTPFIEKENWFIRKNLEYKLKYIFFLRQAKTYKIKKILNKEIVLKNLLKVFWVVDNKHNYQLINVLKLINNFNNFYFFYFGKNRYQVIQLFDEFKKNNS